MTHEANPQRNGDVSYDQKAERKESMFGNNAYDEVVFDTASRDCACEEYMLYEEHVLWLSHRLGLCAGALLCACGLIPLAFSAFLLGADSAVTIVALICLVGSMANAINAIIEHELFLATNSHCGEMPRATMGEIPSACYGRIALAIVIMQLSPQIADAASTLWVHAHVADFVLLAANVICAYLGTSGLMRCFLARSNSCIPDGSSHCTMRVNALACEHEPTTDNQHSSSFKPRAWRLPTAIGCLASAGMWLLGRLMFDLSPFDIMYMGKWFMRLSWVPILAVVLIRLGSQRIKRKLCKS